MGIDLQFFSLATKKQEKEDDKVSEYYSSCKRVRYFLDRLTLDMIKETKYQFTDNLFKIYTDVYMPFANLDKDKKVINSFESGLIQFYKKCVIARINSICGFWYGLIDNRHDDFSFYIPQDLAVKMKKLSDSFGACKWAIVDDTLNHCIEDVKHCIDLHTVQPSIIRRWENIKKCNQDSGYDKISLIHLWEKIKNVNGYLMPYAESDELDTFKLRINKICDLLSAMICISAESFNKWSSCDIDYRYVYTLTEEDRNFVKNSITEISKYGNVKSIEALCMLPRREYTLHKTDEVKTINNSDAINLLAHQACVVNHIKDVIEEDDEDEKCVGRCDNHSYNRVLPYRYGTW